jgi:hypothetical protein
MQQIVLRPPTASGILFFFSRISFVSRAVDFVRLFLQLIDVANDDTDSL